jgi:hypothetical protein
VPIQRVDLIAGVVSQRDGWDVVTPRDAAPLFSATNNPDKVAEF